MSVYYIDYENVHNAGLKGVDALPEGDYVHIFFKDNDTMQLPQVKALLESNADIVFHRVHRTTLNALDFQLLAELFCSADAGCSNYIISRDKGYDSAIDVARAHNILLQRKESIDAPDFIRYAPKSEPADLTEIEDVPESDSGSGSSETLSAAEQGSEGAQAALTSAADPGETPPAQLQGTVFSDSSELSEAESSASAESASNEAAGRKSGRRQRGGRKKSSGKIDLPAVSSSDSSADASSAPSDAAAVSDVELIASVIEKNNIPNIAEEHYALIAEAVRGSDNKNRFYQHFVRAFGADKGQQFYRGIKSYYSKFVEALR